MYIPGRRRTASRPSRTWICSALYSCCRANASAFIGIEILQGTPHLCGGEEWIVWPRHRRIRRWPDSLHYTPQQFRTPVLCLSLILPPLGRLGQLPSTCPRVCVESSRGL